MITSKIVFPVPQFHPPNSTRLNNTTYKTPHDADDAPAKCLLAYADTGICTTCANVEADALDMTRASVLVVDADADAPHQPCQLFIQADDADTTHFTPP